MLRAFSTLLAAAAAVLPSALALKYDWDSEKYDGPKAYFVLDPEQSTNNVGNRNFITMGVEFRPGYEYALVRHFFSTSLNIDRSRLFWVPKLIAEEAQAMEKEGIELPPEIARFYESQSVRFSSSEPFEVPTSSLLSSFEVPGFIDFELLAYIGELRDLQAKEGDSEEGGDDLPVPKVPVKLQVSLDSDLSSLMKRVLSRMDSGEQTDVEVVKGTYSAATTMILDDATREVFPLMYRKKVNFSFKVINPTFAIDIFPFRFSIWRNLQVRPIGVRNTPVKGSCKKYINFIFFKVCIAWNWIIDTNPTGPTGLAFGKPMATSLWGQGNNPIKFHYRSWKFVENSAWKVLSAAEETDLRNSYSDPTAVELFIAKRFTPEDKGGGGYCYSCGSASAGILSTELMASYSIDKTHLAHELGHVVDLSHPPGPSGSLQMSSTGTLMCPSGYKADNPRRNSVENFNNANNPLMYVTLGVRPSTNPDCDDSADCGNCYKVYTP